MSSNPEMMTAMGIEQYGGAEVIKRLQVPRPQMEAEAVLIRVAAAAVNPADWRLRSGQFRNFIRIKDHYILGADIAGVVEAVGASVKAFRPGDRVYTFLPFNKGGGYAQYAAAHASKVAHLPRNLTFTEAAAVPTAALTALQALQTINIKTGDNLLIYGASGGVGTFAVQIAKAMGAQVTGAASGRNAELVKRLGADAFVDYQTADLQTLNAQFDAVFDAVNYLPFTAARGLLKRGGRYVSVNPTVNFSPRTWAQRLTSGMTVKGLFVRADQNDYATLKTWFESGQVRSVIDCTFPFDQVAEALTVSETGRTRGKLVVVVNEALAATAPTQQVQPLQV
ncbi:MAG: NADP-dependent oxidoreductase [Anaerolineae bacterium]